jgi:hypothetical protein
MTTKAKARKSKSRQVFDGEEIAVCFETAIHAQMRLTTDPDTGEVEVELTGFTIPGWMTNFERNQATLAFYLIDGTTLPIDVLPDEVFDSLEGTDVPVDWE